MEAAADEVAETSVYVLDAQGVAAEPAPATRSVFELAVAAVAFAGGGRGKASVAASAFGPYKAIDQVLPSAAAVENVTALKEKFLAVLLLPTYHTHPTQHPYQTSIA